MCDFSIDIKIDSYTCIKLKSSEYPQMNQCYLEILEELLKMRKFYAHIIDEKIKMLEELTK